MPQHQINMKATCQMAEPVKYTFDQAFDGGVKSRFDEERDELKLEISTAREEAFAQGTEKGHAHALEEIEAARLNALQQVAEAANALMQHYSDLEQRMHQDTIQLGYAITRKLIPALIEQFPRAEIESVIKDCLSVAKNEPHLVIRVAEASVDLLSENINTLKKTTAHTGELVLIGASDIGPQDCIVEWPDGGAVRIHNDTQQQIEATIQRFVMGLSSDNNTENQQIIEE